MGVYLYIKMININNLTTTEVYFLMETQGNLYIKGLGNSKVELREENEVIYL